MVTPSPTPGPGTLLVDRSKGPIPVPPNTPVAVFYQAYGNPGDPAVLWLCRSPEPTGAAQEVAQGHYNADGVFFGTADVTVPMIDQELWLAALDLDGTAPSPPGNPFGGQWSNFVELQVSGASSLPPAA